MITNVQDNSMTGLGYNFTPIAHQHKPMTDEETLEFLKQPAAQVKHPVLQSTQSKLYANGLEQLEERIL